MSNFRWQLSTTALALVTVLGASALLAQAPPGASQQIVLNEQLVTTYQPVQRRVVVPIREYRTETSVQNWWNPFQTPQVVTRSVPKLRWEERIETSFVPSTHKQYTAQAQLTQTPGPALVLAAPQPRRTMNSVITTPPLQVAAKPRQMQDNPPLVPVSGAIRQAQAPAANTTLAPRTTIAPATPSTRSSPYGGVQTIDNDPTRSGLRPPVFSR